MTFDAGICHGDFLAPSVEAETRICSRCGAEIDRDDDRLARGLGRHSRMPTVPRGDIPRHLIGREGRVRVPIRVMESVPKHDPLHIFADIRLTLWERIAILVWGRLTVATQIDGVIRVQNPVRQTSYVSVSTIWGGETEPVELQSA